MVRFLSLGLLAMTVSGSVTVRKTGTAPTGYEVDFKYVDKEATSVTLAGGIGLFTDPSRTSLQRYSQLAPSEYKAGYFVTDAFPGPDWPYNLKADDDGVWTLTTPLPSGTYFFSYQVGCDQCEAPKAVNDPDQPRFENVPGDQLGSNFQVPFDPDFQLGDHPAVNFDFAGEAPDGKRGTIQSVNYTSPGSIWPAPDVHDFTIYLPVGYDEKRDQKYPLLYLVHGYCGNGAELEVKGRVSHILDNLIAEGHIEPTVAVMPSQYNLDDSAPLFKPSDGYSFIGPVDVEVLRKNFQDILFPYIETNYNVCTESRCRAIAGISQGATVAYNMWTNATDYFDYFGFCAMVKGVIPSQQLPDADAVIKEKPNAADKGLFLGSGLYDPSAFPMMRDVQKSLDSMGLDYVSRITPFGTHEWPAFQDQIWWFGSHMLWKPYAKPTRVAIQ